MFVRRLSPHVPFVDVHLFSLVLAKGGCIVESRLLATFYLRKPFLAVCLLDLLVPPSHTWCTQVKAEWLYRTSA
jgi:hypothetical protein